MVVIWGFILDRNQIPLVIKKLPSLEETWQFGKTLFNSILLSPAAAQHDEAQTEATSEQSIRAWLWNHR